MNSPGASDPRSELEILLASRLHLIAIESREEGRVLELVRAASHKVRQPRQWAVFQWSATDGMSRLDMDLGGHTKTPQRTRGSAATPEGDSYRGDLCAARFPPVSKRSNQRPAYSRDCPGLRARGPNLGVC